jgi:predicted NUDIX family NTP pyrophosphohydrolase
VHSAGILLFRFRDRRLEVLLGHPGGPLWAHRDEGAWSIPKGLCRPGETPLAAAQREFREETGFSVQGRFTALGSACQRSGKIVHAWALEKNIDASRVTSNTFSLEWPRDSGNIGSWPELDRAAWFDLPTARVKISAGQAVFLDRLEEALRDSRT